VEENAIRTGIGDIPLTGRLQQALSRSGTARDVIVGIRPENFEDASTVPADMRPHGITFQASIDVLESLGSEKYVYFTQETGGVDAAELTELARDSGRADTGADTETVVARLDPETRISEGDNAELWVDGRALHVFDPATGQNLTLGDSGSPASSGGGVVGDAPAQADGATSGQDTGSATAPPR
jgi:multiple sugar transport system ATP-binding protein